MKHLIACLCLWLAVPAIAETMSAEEFDAFTRGKTFYYGTNGQAYGAEEYLSNRRVIWTFLDGRCQEGYWYEHSGMICFEYEQLQDVQCWSFRESPGGGLIAKFQDDPGELELYEVERSHEPLSCLGPDVGV
ncbi:hypothetical protein EI983_05125 [Roseovarius faecimaris]|uniref:DUF995 domain-containing protein n=2 Tax=Roseovarius faecimaris TaxID=2494550 RepID=A0A6I6IM89_9RHOB|nr:hypothetical protein EI983_05125 [Roseovarius faecimaris]